LAKYRYKQAKGICRKHLIPRLWLHIKSVYEINTAGNENRMKAIIASNGPVVIAVEVTKTFQLYKRGILEDASANNDCSSVNHAVVLVGYGHDEHGREYW
jgi:C1A family cysteine protease